MKTGGREVVQFLGHHRRRCRAPGRVHASIAQSGEAPQGQHWRQCLHRYGHHSSSWGKFTVSTSCYVIQPCISEIKPVSLHGFTSLVVRASAVSWCTLILINCTFLVIKATAVSWGNLILINGILFYGFSVSRSKDIYTWYLTFLTRVSDIRIYFVVCGLTTEGQVNYIKRLNCF